MYKVYWTNPDNNEAYSEDFEDLSATLKQCEMLRQSGRTFVTMISENPNQVGKAGVAAVTNGKLPDGSDYDWKKRRDSLGLRDRNVISTDNIEVKLDDD